MRWLLDGIVVGLAAMATFVIASQKPEADRSTHREAVAPGEWVETQFDCRNGTACWETVGYQLCTDYILRFEPPMTNIVSIRLTQPVDALRDRAGVRCWRPGEEVGDDEQGFLLEHAEPMAAGEFYEETRLRFTSGPVGVAACRIYGEAEFVIWEP